MAEIKLIETYGNSSLVPASGVAVKRGNLLGYSSGWVLADADTAVDVYAQWIAMENVSGDGVKRIAVCKRAIIVDEDAPYTADTAQYASGTAGAFTETRPATDGDLIQVVGRSMDTKTVCLDIQVPQEWEMFLSPDVYDGTGEPGLGTADAGWVGPQLDAASETFYFKGRLPSGLIGSIVEARIVYNSIGASAYDNDVTIVGGYDGASNVQDTGTAITAGDWNEDADNKLLYQDVSVCFDAGFYMPGRNFCVLGDPDGITGDAQVIGLSLRGWKV